MRYSFLCLLVILLFGHPIIAQYDVLNNAEKSYSLSAISLLKQKATILENNFNIYSNPIVYKSLAQGFAYKIRLKGNQIEEANQAILSGISWDDFLIKFPLANVDTPLLMVKENVKTVKGEAALLFHSVGTLDELDYGISTEQISMYNNSIQHKWLIEYIPKSVYYEGRLMAYYFPEELKHTTLPERYQHMIHFSDYIFDTAFSLDTFTWLYDADKIQVPNNWQALAYKDQIALLDTLLHTRVIGWCSMDSSPLDHLLLQSQVAAETGCWNAFIHAYFQYVNEFVLRTAYSTYAIFDKHNNHMLLEQIFTSPITLILGTSLQIDNPLNNRMTSASYHMGAAISQFNDVNNYSEKLINMMTDSSLDLYNRIIILDVYHHFTKLLKDKELSLFFKNKLEATLPHFPSYLQKKYTH